MRLRHLALPVLLLAACGREATEPKEPQDRLAAEIGGCTAKGCQPAAQALRDGRRLLALKRFTTTKMDLATQEYLRGRSAGQRRDMAAFEAEWTRMGGVLRDGIGAPSPAAFEGVEPALVRAIGEAALLQTRGYYQASLDQGRNTSPREGLLYLGNAYAQREIAELCRRLAEPMSQAPPPVRALDPDLDALQAEMLAAYRPPASVDKHSWFINASSLLKEARELNAAGLRYGALLRYLQSAQLLAPLLPDPPALDAGTFAQRLRELDSRLSVGDVDHSLGRMFLEAAQAEPEGSPTAAVIVNYVLPRYFAALGPAPSAAPKPAPQVTVTLVRWPYT
ncbi:MAG TPA: hypothetical protein VMW27_14145 [Thermoanaerobaculia bacterium]|nr:hypothetical protein [Thermoanaerobaculia bacterium]